MFLSIQLAWWQVRACKDALLDISTLIYTKLDLITTYMGRMRISP
jgi:hypothetical protein